MMEKAKDKLNDVLDLAKRFKSASTKLVMERPETFLPLFSNNGELPTPLQLKSTLEEGYPSVMKPMVHYVIGILFALNAIGRMPGAFLYRTFFLAGQEDSFQDTYSHSSFYRNRNAAIDAFWDLLHE